MSRELVGCVVLALGLVALASTAAAEAASPPWALPPADQCTPEGGLRGLGGDLAGPPPFQPGDAFSFEQVEMLRDYIPEPLWEFRDRFFYEGMRLQIGGCFADYGPPKFFQEATDAFSGRVRLLDNGGLADHTAGTPFPTQRIAADDPQAALKWAWNLELRYQGAGFRGPFRTVDMVGRDGRGEPFLGEIFKAQLAFRADRSGDDYTAPGSKHKHWVAGGIFFAPFEAREYAWRQYRDVDHLTDMKRSDDLHAYLPKWRRTRRVSAAGVEGLYMPSFSVGVTETQGAGPGGGADGAGSSAIGGSSASTSIATKRSGFEGLEIRPLLYDFELKGVRDVLTPLNAANASYPEEEDRQFGPWGLSFASDHWDLRRAVVIEGRLKTDREGGKVDRVVLYIDAQTHQPLYYMSRRFYPAQDAREVPIDVGMFVGRWSEGRSDYPRWPDDPERPIRVIDPVGASFANISEDGGWRRESWTMVSTPPPDSKLKRELSTSALTKRR